MRDTDGQNASEMIWEGDGRQVAEVRQRKPDKGVWYPHQRIKHLKIFLQYLQNIYFTKSNA